MEEACRRGLAGGLDFPEEAYKEKMAWGTRAKCSTVRWPTQRAAIADAARCDDRCTALPHPPENTAAWRAAPKGGRHSRLYIGRGRFLQGCLMPLCIPLQSLTRFLFARCLVVFSLL